MQNTYTNTLYTKDSDGSLRQWHISVDEAVVTVEHGKLNGKLVQEQYLAKPKNVGKANETSASFQAVLEAQSKVALQLKRGYFLTPQEALAYQDITPMKLQDYKKHGSKIHFPVFAQLKIDGLRYLVDEQLHAQSKAGEAYHTPEHIQHDLEVLKEKLGEDWQGVDGELYAGLPEEGGLSLQEIVSAFRKKNKDTLRLKHYIYDIPVEGIPWYERAKQLAQIEEIIQKEGLSSLVVLRTIILNNKEQLLDYFSFCVEEGQEGIVLRNRDGYYAFGKRSYDVQKLKREETTEAFVTGVECDKSNEGVLSCELEDGTAFKCKMLKNAGVDSEGNSLRSFEGALSVVHSWIEVKFESLSNKGVPLKPVGVRVRSVENISGNWIVKE